MRAPVPTKYLTGATSQPDSAKPRMNRKTRRKVAALKRKGVEPELITQPGIRQRVLMPDGRRLTVEQAQAEMKRQQEALEQTVQDAAPPLERSFIGTRIDAGKF